MQSSAYLLFFPLGLLFFLFPTSQVERKQIQVSSY